jgi:hypothetical protein
MMSVPSFPGAADRSRERFAHEAGVTACAFCDWTFHGSFEEGRKRAEAHRARKHPQAIERDSSKSVRRPKRK